jgi:hypothetical protein
MGWGSQAVALVRKDGAKHVSGNVRDSAADLAEGFFVGRALVAVYKNGGQEVAILEQFQPCFVLAWRSKGDAILQRGRETFVVTG